MIASATRSIKSGAEYNRYFDLSGVQGNEVTLISDGSVEQTINEMKKVVRKTLHQTKKIAPALKGSSKMETSRNIWNFVYNHIQYKKDHPLREQLRTPARSWKDRLTGVDCDCYSILISSILTNLNISHSFRIAAYKADFQHVYVVVPDGAKEIIIDCVADSFNYEVPFTKKKDFTVMNGTALNGIAGVCRSEQPAIVYMSRDRIEKRGYVFTSDVLKKYGVSFTEVIGENNVPAIHATINGKQVILPTAITRERAKTILATAPALKAPELSGTTYLSTKNIITGLGIGAALWYFFSGGSNSGLSGPDKTPVKKIAVVKI